MSFIKTLDTFSENDALGTKLAHHLNPDLILKMLTATGKMSIRRRNLPAEHVAWLTIAMAIYRRNPIRKVVDELDLSLNGTIFSSSITAARKRLGAEPLKWLFEHTAERWCDPVKKELYKGLQVFALDGTGLNVPDSDDNRNHFGKHKAREVFLPYPQVRSVLLLDVGGRMLRGANFGPVGMHESKYANDLFGNIPENSVTIMDRGFCSYRLFSRLLARSGDRHFLCRVKKKTRLYIKEKLPDGSHVCVMKKTYQKPELGEDIPKELLVRVVDFKRKGSNTTIRTVSSLLDYKKFPAKDFSSLYHKRWDIETAIGEIKTHLLDRKEAIRSKHPDGVKQELWAIFLAYNLIRREMAVVARANGANPERLSFKMTMRLIDGFFRMDVDPMNYGRIPEYLISLRERIWLFRNPESRRRRSCPRTIKIRNLSYPQTYSKPPEMALLGP